jgi:hypothetical protein
MFYTDETGETVPASDDEDADQVRMCAARLLASIAVGLIVLSSTAACMTKTWGMATNAAAGHDQ